MSSVVLYVFLRVWTPSCPSWRISDAASSGKFLEAWALLIESLAAYLSLVLLRAVLGQEKSAGFLNSLLVSRIHDQRYQGQEPLFPHL